jgi:hypothetical protein
MDDTIERYGGDPSAVLHFDHDGPELLPYATLIAARNSGVGDFLALEGVYEWQGRPLIILVRGDALGPDSNHLSRLRRAAAMRGDAPYLGVVEPGRLTVYQVGLDNLVPAAARIQLPADDKDRQATIAFLGNERPTVARPNWISDVVLRLLTSSIDALISCGLSDGDAISLVGRALFVRFLADRGLLASHTLPSGHKDPATLFDSVTAIRATSRWLDEIFNGDFLPISGTALKSLSKTEIRQLGNIMRRAPDGQLSLGWQEKWDFLDFSQIPVGVLSQAYECYLSKHDAEKQRREGGYYTPSHIADLMVRAAFQAIQDNGKAHLAKVLDPAAGAGVFLLTAFRQIVAERWRHDRRRPNTKVLRSILYRQIVGFDVNESALRFAALGLYLMSIELDPHPEPLRKLRFTNLRDCVLHKFSSILGSNKARKANLGALGHEVGDKHLRAYDLVIGNPPWSTSTGLHGWTWLEEQITAIARERIGDKTVSAPIPNEILDLPFVWRALEWGKPGAQIAFAMHARILFQQGESMPEARSALFKALDVTGVINGTELRNTKVWPGITAPFCLLFARNRRPPPGSGFRLVTPRLEEGLNSNGAWRLDISSAETVTTDEMTAQPTLLKTLFRGSRLDREIFDRIALRKWPTIEEYWFKSKDKDGKSLLFTGNGYQRLRSSSEIQKNGDGRPGVSAAYLHEFLEFDEKSISGLLIDSRKLQPFREKRIHRRRPVEIFEAPLLLFRESPPAASGRILASVAEQSLIYNQSFHGYSANRHPDGLLLTRYLALVISSKLTLWRALITSGRFGFEREVIEKFIVDKTPIPTLDSLKPADRKRIDRLFNKVSRDGDSASWNEVDAWVGSIYGLSEPDIRVIADTLRFNLPFAANRKIAQMPPTPSESAEFCVTLAGEFSEWAARYSRKLFVTPVPTSLYLPWQFVYICSERSPDIAQVPDPYAAGIVGAADSMAATEILIADDERDGLWLGRLKQARYWTHSQAKLAARHIIWSHVEFLTGSEAA